MLLIIIFIIIMSYSDTSLQELNSVLGQQRSPSLSDASHYYFIIIMSYSDTSLQELNSALGQQRSPSVF